MRPQMFMRHLASLALTFIGAAHAAGTFVEAPGAADSPLISRYAGSALVQTSQEPFAAVRVPLGPGHYGKQSDLVFDKVMAVEGRIDGYFYVAPAGRTALEVFRNYQVALAQNAFTTLYSCDMRDCDRALIRETFANEIVRVRQWVPRGGMPGSSIDRDVRFLSAKATRNGNDVYVMLFVAEPNSSTQAPAVVLIVAQPAPMEAGKVTVSADRLKGALETEGKIALYGIYFDTGKAELKSESKAQIDEMSKALEASKALKVLIVGHTDNQGTIESNLLLSQHRAEAVVAALARDHGIDRTRLRAQGVANFSPVATNLSETGRALNRRVEMVTQ